MSKLASFLKSFYDSPPYRCLILGRDGVGKTTALYRMVLDTVVTTIPTIGFNFEEVRVGKDVLSFWDIGGCDSIRPLTRHYMCPGHSILFLVDTPACVASEARLVGALDDLVRHSREAAGCGVLFVGVALVKQDLLPAGASEQISRVADRVGSAMETVFPGGCAALYDVYTNEERGGISAAAGPGFEDGWLPAALLAGIKNAQRGAAGIRREDSAGAGSGAVAIAASRPALELDQLRALVQRQNDGDGYADLTPREFIGEMESGALERWDHRAHLRAGFYILLDHLRAGRGLWDAAEDFLGKLENMLANDSKNAEAEKREKRFRNTVHRTMTTFYLHSIHTAILAFMDSQHPSHALPKPTQFDDFLLANPHLMDSSLWSAYYSKQLLFSPAAKSAWRLPDLKPLPDHIRFSHTTTSDDDGATRGPTDPRPAEKDHLRRFAFATLQRVKRTGARRGKVVKEALNALQQHTMGLRARGADIDPYSETQAYFWIQLLHAAVASLGAGAGAGAGIDVAGLSYESFVLLFPDLMRRRDKGREAWRPHYTEKAWESLQARMAVVLPGRAPLPNLIVPPTEREREMAVVREMEIRSLVQSGAAHGRSEMEMMLHEFWVVAEIQEAAAASHGKVVWRIFSALWEAKVGNSRSGGVASNELVDEDLRGRGDTILGVTEKVFWVRVVLKRFLGFEIMLPAGKSVTGQGEGREEISLREFRRFLGGNRELSLENLWRPYYSEETWQSRDAKERFVPPDLKEMATFV